MDINNSQSGQAMVEFIIGLVAVIALTATLLQIAALTKASTDTMFEARRLAGESAISELPSLSNPNYIKDWEEGSDEREITPDDTWTMGNGFEFENTILDKSVESADQWSIVNEIPLSNPLTDLQAYSANPSAGFGLVEGTDTKTVPLLKAVQQLIYDKEAIDIKSEVWMTWTKGIY